MRVRTTALAVLAVLPVVMGSATGAPGETPAGPDPRVALHLAPQARERLLATMREHLEALQAVVAALARERYEEAAKVAHEELGFPKHHQVMRRERGAEFPERYRELAMAHHRAAEDLAAALPTRETGSILQALDGTMRACVACHRAFELAPTPR